MLVFFIDIYFTFLWYFFLRRSITFSLSSISWGLMPNLLVSTIIFFFEEFRHRVRSREVPGFVRDGVVAFLEKVFTALLDVCHLWNIFVCMEVME